MPTLVEYVRTNFVNISLVLTNWTYRTSDKFEFHWKQHGYYDQWGELIGVVPWSSSVLWINYNLWGGRHVLNFRHGGSYSGDSNYVFSDPYDYNSEYCITVNGNLISIKNVTNNTTVLATQTLGTATDTDTDNVTLLPKTANSSVDCSFYGLKVYREGVLIHNYVPCQEGIYDEVDDIIFSLPSGVTYGPIKITTYTISYNANGGTGSMENQTVERDESVALERNLFERENYVFIGWAIRPRGKVVYTNQEYVTNLAEAGTIIVLYAVWEFVKLELILSHNKSDERQIFKVLLDEEKIIGTLREESSIINPVIMVESDKILNFNFVYIPKFRRYYFIRDIESFRKKLWVITLECDVLMSFKNDISTCEVVVDKQTMRTNGDEYIDDNSLVCDNYMYNTVYNFDGQQFNESPTYILITAG